ncbi:hypothetical protein GCM10023322_67220 [Rugosimonospora acidiphila]|uniref:WXG100 family type VII secretion target n=1 Tax=Rugosimonospora acidiphila TaxID=556531 RepID=A0ABP9SLV3_9ACTN
MEFSVNSAALTGLVEMLDRRWQDYESGRTYLKANAHFSVTGEGVLNLIHGQHQKIVNEIDAFLSTAAQGFAGPCSTAVAQANSLYRRSDLAAVARNDATMPAPPAPNSQCPPDPVPAPGPGAARADPGLGPGVFSDPVCPSSWYRQPPDHRSDYPCQFSCFDAVSPTGWGREMIWRITGLAARFGLIDRPYDVLMEAVEPLCGDWAGYLACADVYDNLAGAINDTARCMVEGGDAIARVWTGNAAEACAQGMGRFATELTSAVAPLHRTATAYREVAEGVYLQAEVVAAALTMILDTMVESALQPETLGLLEPFELATEVSDLIRIVEKIREIGRLVARARDVADASMNTASSGLDGFGVVSDRHPVPVLAPTVPALPG